MKHSVLDTVPATAQGSSSIGQSPGLQNRWLGVRVPPALRVRSGEPAKAGGRIGEDMATQTRGEAPEKRSGSGGAAKSETRSVSPGPPERIRRRSQARDPDHARPVLPPDGRRAPEGYLAYPSDARHLHGGLHGLRDLHGRHRDGPRLRVHQADIRAVRLAAPVVSLAGGAGGLPSGPCDAVRGAMIALTDRGFGGKREQTCPRPSWIPWCRARREPTRKPGRLMT